MIHRSIAAVATTALLLACVLPSAASAAVLCPDSTSPGPCRAYANSQITNKSNIDGVSVESVNADDMTWDSVGNSLILKSIWYVFPTGTQYIEFGSRLGYLWDGRSCDPACAYWEIERPDGSVATDIIGPNPIAGAASYQISRNTDGTFSLWLGQGSSSWSRSISSFQNSGYDYAGWLNFGFETSDPSNTFYSGSYHDYMEYSLNGTWYDPTSSDVTIQDTHLTGWNASSSFAYDPLANISTTTYSYSAF